MKPGKYNCKVIAPSNATVAIYLLRCPIDGLVKYVGKTVNPEKRLKEHTSRASSGGMRRWIMKIASDGLKPILEIIEWCANDIWKDRERHWIANFRAESELLNVRRGGDGPGDFTAEIREKMSAWQRGRILTKEHCAKISAGKIARKLHPSLEALEKMRVAATGRRHSAVSIAKMRAASLGRIVSSETREKLRVANLWMKSSPEHCLKMSIFFSNPSAETRKRMSDAHRGKKLSQSSIEKRSAKRRGSKLSEETKFKISSALMGHPVSEDTRAKLRSAAKFQKQYKTNNI